MQVSQNISNHPELTEVRRKAFFSRLEVDMERRSVVLHLVIRHYDVNMSPLRTLADQRVKLTANNSIKVDVNGSITPRDSPSWHTALGEFDFMEQMTVSGNTMSSALYPIVLDYVTISDARGRFGASIYK